MKKHLKNLLKRGFDALGYEVRRKITQRTNMAEVLEHMKVMGLAPKTVIDVGVAHGTFELYDAFPKSMHLLIEPLEEFKNSLDDICRKFKAQYVLAAATDKPGAVIFNVHNILTGSTMFREVEGSHVDGVQREVPSVKIDDVCKEKNLSGPFILKLDIHGSELLALDGARKVLEDTELVILEVHMFQAL